MAMLLKRQVEPARDMQAASIKLLGVIVEKRRKNNLNKAAPWPEQSSL
ncbi:MULTISPECIES: hypothetical protein [Ralstonia solanacearum species complex]|uniref:Uncharacterized protein n=2 Tax=Ralstonia solanacearum TaxID=305 RepID=A0AAE3NBQ1_RALSL|nr:hypothetical protein [Ralstonia solanacearum]MBB6584105.1 hypothetical protein [Ralstonia solanacearum]MBB6588829.1 hypothetical protein [Ralstonia solanacearum]MBB6593064.1 hypothetical protein [Ralstonia solanacearum]MBB6597291.1 hypothetical protein [Ralstonia solanacearum]MCG3573960.1 hypothetical protein [Ralstonia solanacearum]